MGFGVEFDDALFAKMLGFDILHEECGASNEIWKTSKVKSNFVHFLVLLFVVLVSFGSCCDAPR